jgi:hypothetical protein
MKKEIKRLELAGPKSLQFLSRISVSNDAFGRLVVNRIFHVSREDPSDCLC